MQAFRKVAADKTLFLFFQVQSRLSSLLSTFPKAQLMGGVRTDLDT